MKNIVVKVAGTGESSKLHEITIKPGTSVRDIKDALGLQDYKLSKGPDQGFFADDDVIYEQVEGFDIKWVKPASQRESVEKVVDKFWPKISDLQEEKKQRIKTLKHGDELPSGVLQMVKVYVAAKRTLSIGDKKTSIL